jgi:hypothetical protein
MEYNRLTVCRKRIADTVSDFEEAEESLCELATFVLKETL